MVGVGIVAFVWWGVSLITIVIITIGLACLIPVYYAWIMSRRIDRVLENIIHNEGSEQKEHEATKQKHDYRE